MVPRLCFLVKPVVMEKDKLHGRDAARSNAQAASSQVRRVVERAGARDIVADL